MVTFFLLMSAASWIAMIALIFVKRTRKIGFIVAQLYILAIIYAFLRGDEFSFAFVLYCPPVAYVSIVYQLTSYAASWMILPFALPVAALVFWSIFRLEKFRIWALFPVAIAFIAVALVVGQIRTPHIMCKRALEIGATEIHHASFIWSLRNPRHQFESMHQYAQTFVDGKPYAWTYSKMKWIDWRKISGNAPILDQPIPSHMIRRSCN